MKYKLFVISDTHSFFSETKKALTDAGYFSYKGPKKVVLCGDAFDRGKESREMESFLMKLMKKNELIYIRGNHEDLMLIMLDNLLNDIESFSDGSSYHLRNRTFDTASQLTMLSYPELLLNPHDFISRGRQTDFVKKLIPATVNYFETKNYIFVHGWIPCNIEKVYGYRFYQFRPDWRNATEKEWDAARWINGMDAACYYNCIEDGKTIVCGHWHSSFGHSKIHKICTEFGEDAVFEPFIDNGIIAIDACTIHSGKVNCIVIEDELLEE